MSFADIQFPVSLSQFFSGGPQFNTEVVETAGGQEQRNQRWATPLARYELRPEQMNPAEVEELLAFFHARKGQMQGFRFKDWTDYQTSAATIGTGDDSTTSFQLVRHYSSGGDTVTRTIAKPVSGTVDVYVDSVLQASGVSVNATTGIVTFDTAPADGEVIRADFDFDVPVRFATDWLQLRYVEEGRYQLERNIALTEVRL